MDGVGFDTFMTMPYKMRWYLNRALDDIIEMTDGSDQERPKRWRK